MKISDFLLQSWVELIFSYEMKDDKIQNIFNNVLSSCTNNVPVICALLKFHEIIIFIKWAEIIQFKDKKRSNKEVIENYIEKRKLNIVCKE
jgi:hypothetical protein